jgi:4-amino-4-deoxy-L-arabinose transferase-like glycosyltransferase
MAAARLLRPIEILVERLLDPGRRERAAAAVLLAYTAIWTLYGVLSKATQDVHVDMSELVAWSREPALGYPKHPPLAAWLVRAWFSAFPTSDWAYHLLAIATATLALWIAWRLMARCLSPEKQVLGVALLTLIPFFNFHALKFNVNTVLLPLWAATTFWFLRSYETRRILYAALAGLGAAGSMLGKYWSIFLLAGLALAALIDRRRGEYFRSPAPWVTVLVGAIVLAPHLAWLYAHDFETFSYALKGQAQPKSFSEVVIRTAGYLAGGAAYVALPVVLAWINTRPSRAGLRDTLVPQEPDRQLAALAFWAPLLLPAFLALIFRIELTSLWTLPAFALLPVVLLSSPLIKIDRLALLRVVAFAVLFPLVALALAPAIAWSTHRAGVAPPAAHVSLLAPRLAAEWRQATGKPLKIVGGSAELAYGIAFYLPGTPSAYPEFSRQLAPWIDPAQVMRDGIAIVCLTSDQGCLAGARAQGEAARVASVQIARRYLGAAGQPERYSFFIIPPRG